MWCRKNTNGVCLLEKLSSDNESADYLETKICNSSSSDSGTGSASSSDYGAKPLMFQKGVLRTNCIDCLDRTNVAQYAYGLAALGFQLNALGVLESSKIDLDNPLAKDLMGLYEIMGDTLALQYGGSAAHNKVIFYNFAAW